MAADRATRERLKDKKRVVNAKVYIHPDQLANWEDLAMRAGTLAKAGKRFGQPSWRTLFAAIGSLDESDRDFLAEVIRDLLSGEMAEEDA